METGMRAFHRIELVVIGTGDSMHLRPMPSVIREGIRWIRAGAAGIAGGLALPLPAPP
jgi:hypothetical protein